jgi:hypothetical protein
MKGDPMKDNVEAAITQNRPRHTPDLLLRHCLALAATAEPRPPARIRLEEALGPELAQRLLSALSPQSRR